MAKSEEPVDLDPKQHRHLSHGERATIDRMVEPLARFLSIETVGGIILIICTVVALVLANSTWRHEYHELWEIEIGFQVGEFSLYHPLELWITDGLMTIFFFVVGLEIKRELSIGELRDWRTAILPIMAAVGGMAVPALIFLSLQMGAEGEKGFGVPMATDIAFVVGILAILGNRVPAGLKIFLLSLAIVDDLGAVLVVAIFYTEQIHVPFLLVAVLGMGAVTIFQRVGVWFIPMYAVIGAVIWFAIYESGIHPTIAGVVMGLATPVTGRLMPHRPFEYAARAREKVPEGTRALFHEHTQERLFKLSRLTRLATSPLAKLESALHGWVAYFIMPLFALANAGVFIQSSAFTKPLCWAVALGLVLGKPIGIVLATWLTVVVRLGRLPAGVNWPALIGAGCLGGIGFTMSLFISSLAFEGDLLATAKIGTLTGSVLSAVLGAGILYRVLPRSQDSHDSADGSQEASVQEAAKA